MIKHIILIILLLLPSSIAYSASNSQLNITIYDNYNSYSKEANNLNTTFSPSQQGYTKEQNSLNITMYYSFYSPPAASGSTTTTPATTTPASGGGGGGGGSSPDTEIVYVDRPIPIINEVIREIASQPEIIYKEVLKESPYRLSSVLLAIIMVILLSIRIGSFISQRRKAPYYPYVKMLKKEIKSKLKQGYTKQQILKASMKAKWPQDMVKEELDKY